ncbi:MAG: Cna B-type domain-containing protein [Huintestinicola sp.]|uniref:Cna B-type domain-containing protein n=1 Tax=Huintestinicola sp. TaxID=2981661 RepID=UPI003F054DF3
MFSSSIKRKAAGFLAAVMAMSIFNSFPANIAAEEEAGNVPVVSQTLEADPENAEAILFNNESAVFSGESAYDVSFSGTVNYSGDESWKSLTRPVSFDSSAIELHAVTADGEIPLDLQSTNYSGNIYMQYVDGDDGGGTFNISKVPSKINGVDISLYKLHIPKSAYYSEAAAEVTANNRAILTLNPITSGLTISKKVPGGVDTSTNFPVKITLSKGSGSVTIDKTLTVSAGADSSAANIRVPVGVECTVSEDLSGLVGYKLSSYAFSDDGNASFNESKDPIPFTPEENSEYFVEIINARYNTTVSWTVKWVDNNASDGRNPRFTLMYSLDGGEPFPLNADSLDMFGLDAVPAAVCSNPAASNNYRYSYSGLPNAVNGSTVTYSVTEEADNYICEYDSNTDTFINTLTADYSAKLKWSDSAVQEDRPSAESVIGKLHLYKCINGAYTDITNDTGLSISDGETSEWTIKAEKPLPRYTADNRGIEYSLICDEISSDYVLTYNNGQGTYGNIFDRCYSGGTIVATISGTCNFEASLEWLDNDSTLRPKASFTLMRYIMANESDTEITAENLKRATKVIAKAPNSDSQTVLTYEIPAGTAGNDVTISFDHLFPQGYSLPKFDENGARYFYFVEEVLDDGNETNYSVVYPANGYGAANGGTIQNVLSAETAIKVNKIWQAPSSLKDLEQAELRFALICQDNEGTYYEIDSFSQGSNTLSGFGNSVSSKETTFVVSLRNDEGKMLTPVGIKEYVTLNSSAVDCSYSSDELSAEFKIKDNTYVSSCLYKETTVSTEFDGIPMYVYEVTNSVKNLQDYTIKKVWGDGVTHQTLEFTITGKSAAGPVAVKYTAVLSADENGTPLSAELKNSSGDVLLSDVPITSSGNNWSATFANLFPMYTDDGYYITYTVSEKSGGDWTYTS